MFLMQLSSQCLEVVGVPLPLHLPFTLFLSQLLPQCLALPLGLFKITPRLHMLPLDLLLGFKQLRGPLFECVHERLLLGEGGLILLDFLLEVGDDVLLVLELVQHDRHLLFLFPQSLALGTDPH